MSGYREISYLPLTPALAKVGVGGSNPLARSKQNKGLARKGAVALNGREAGGKHRRQGHAPPASRLPVTLWRIDRPAGAQKRLRTAPCGAVRTGSSAPKRLLPRRRASSKSRR